MPSSSAIDSALLSKLIADAQLTALMPDGVWWAEAKPGKKRFVIVDLDDEHDEGQFGSRAFEDALYLVKAVGLSTDAAPLAANTMDQAEARIEALLEGGTLTVAGYTLMTMHREERIRVTEVDEIDPSIRWQHRGGRYRVVASL